MKEILKTIIQNPLLHAKWLNTLSYLENCGARKIAACEHPTLVKEEMLKHASEEFRHAHYLKRQMEKLDHRFEDYALSSILGGFFTLHYLARLDLMACRYLRLPKREIREAAYILVTYAIEVRAEQLYPIYEELLREAGSNIYVKSIVLEEEEHLNEMRAAIQKLPKGEEHVKAICAMEETLFQNWIKAIRETLNNSEISDSNGFRKEKFILE